MFTRRTTLNRHARCHDPGFIKPPAGKRGRPRRKASGSAGSDEDDEEDYESSQVGSGDEDDEGGSPGNGKRGQGSRSSSKRRRRASTSAQRAAEALALFGHPEEAESGGEADKKGEGSSGKQASTSKTSGSQASSSEAKDNKSSASMNLFATQADASAKPASAAAVREAEEAIAGLGMLNVPRNDVEAGSSDAARRSPAPSLPPSSSGSQTGGHHHLADLSDAAALAQIREDWPSTVPSTPTMTSKEAPAAATGTPPPPHSAAVTALSNPNQPQHSSPLAQSTSSASALSGAAPGLAPALAHQQPHPATAGGVGAASFLATSARGRARGSPAVGDGGNKSRGGTPALVGGKKVK